MSLRILQFLDFLIWDVNERLVRTQLDGGDRDGGDAEKEEGQKGKMRGQREVLRGKNRYDL